MKNRNAIIDALNAAIEIEHTLAMQCYQQSLSLRGPSRLQIAPYIENLGEEARDHARKFGQKVVALGGMPSVTVGETKLSTSGEAMLADDLELERRALRAYVRALELVADDVALRTMLEDHIEAEQRHIEELELLVAPATAGEAYGPTASVRRVS